MNDYECQHQPNDADREPQIPCVLAWNPTRAFAVRNGRIKRLDALGSSVGGSQYTAVFLCDYIIHYLSPGLHVSTPIGHHQAPRLFV